MAKGKAKGSGKVSRREFYSQVLDEAERLEFEQASQIEGIDQEIALLRVKFMELLKKHPDRIDQHFEAANVIARLVKVKYQISKEQKQSLKDAITRVLTEVAAPLGVGIGMGVGSRLK